MKLDGFCLGFISQSVIDFVVVNKNAFERLYCFVHIIEGIELYFASNL